LAASILWTAASGSISTSTWICWRFGAYNPVILA
jgi:hypothetical protein